MRASQVGTIIGTGVLDIRGYILAKYDGLFPSNYPSKAEYEHVCAEIRKDKHNTTMKKTREKMDKVIKSFRKEWVKQQ